MTKAEIALVRSLSDKKGRAAEGLFVAEGEKVVAEMLGSGLRVRKVFRCPETSGGGSGIEGGQPGTVQSGSAAERDRPATSQPGTGNSPVTVRSESMADGQRYLTETVSRKEMQRISALKTPTDVLALVEIPHYRFDLRETRGNLTIALDNVQDPGNLGTIIRLADWFGVRDVVCSESTADCYNPKVVQATMGSIARVRVHYLPLCPLLEDAAREGIPVYGAFLDGENIYTAGLTPAGILVMGNEGQGISPAVETHIGRRLYIPPYPPDRSSAESLNVAIATAVACSEFRRRR